jgi:hypothetical protein
MINSLYQPLYRSHCNYDAIPAISVVDIQTTSALVIGICQQSYPVTSNNAKENYFLYRAQIPPERNKVFLSNKIQKYIDMQFNDVNKSSVLNILDFNCKNILTSIPLFDVTG